MPKLNKSRHLKRKAALYEALFSECVVPSNLQLSYSIRQQLECLSEEERINLASRTRDDCAPLFIASKRGNVKIVQYLINVCGVNIEQRGEFDIMDNFTSHFVTPLWVASVADKLDVVKCLVEHGADVNSLSDSGYTALHYACLFHRSSVIRYLVSQGADISIPNADGLTCLMHTLDHIPLCQFLITKGADVNARDLKSNTVLHYAIFNYTSDSALLLLKNGADPWLTDRDGNDALQAACLTGNSKVFQHLIENYTYSRERLIEAHELMGTSLFGHKWDLALDHWRTALWMRYKHPRIEKPTTSSNSIFHGATEFTTMEELERLNLDQVRIQSLIMCERILGPLHRTTIARLMKQSAIYKENFNYSKFIDFTMYALDLKIQRETLLDSEVCDKLEKFLGNLRQLFDNYATRDNVPFQLGLALIKLICSHVNVAEEFTIAEPRCKEYRRHFDKVVRILAHLLFFLNVLAETADDMKQMRVVLHHIIKRDLHTSSGDSLLHIIVSRSDDMTLFVLDDSRPIFPNPYLTQLFLNCGANVNGVDKHLNTPLHVASKIENYCPAVIHVLLQHGAHMDQRNDKGVYPYQLLEKRGFNHLNYTSLKCLAARIIMKKNIYFPGRVPKVLENFIQCH